MTAEASRPAQRVRRTRSMEGVHPGACAQQAASVRRVNGRRSAGILIVILCGLGVLRGGERVGAQMPDPKQMSGIPRPVDDLPNGSVSVRVIRGDLSNNITGHPIEMHVGDKVQTVNTDADGRAQFDKLPSGTTLK